MIRPPENEQEIRRFNQDLCKVVNANSGYLVNVRDFGAVGTGTQDDSVAIQRAIDSVRTTGGQIIFPLGTYLCDSGLEIDESIAGVSFIGLIGFNRGDSGSGTVTLRYTAASGNLLRAHSSHGISFRGLKFEYDNVAYADDLFDFDHSLVVRDPSYLRFEDCVFAGVSPATSASSFIRFNKVIISYIRGCHFIRADTHLRLGDGNYCNVVQVENTAFNDSVSQHIRIGAGAEQIVISGNTFEPRSDGTSGSISMDTTSTGYIWALAIRDNWFGDISAPGGDHVTLRNVAGLNVQGNRFGDAGSGAGDTSLVINVAEGVNIVGNRFESSTGIDFAGSCLGVFIAGNDFSGATPLANTSNIVDATSAMFGNDGINGVTHPFTTKGEGSLAGGESGVHIGYRSTLTTGVTPAVIAWMDTALGYGNGALGIMPSDAAGANAPVVIYSGNTRTARLEVGSVISALTGFATKRVALTYSASIGINASLGNVFSITADDNVNFAVQNPSNSETGQQIRIRVRNNSGGALGTLTFGTDFKIGAAWTQPATGYSRSIDFEYDGTNWVEANRSAADVAN